MRIGVCLRMHANKYLANTIGIKIQFAGVMNPTIRSIFFRNIMNRADYLELVQLIESKIELLKSQTCDRDRVILCDLSKSINVIKEAIYTEQLSSNPLKCLLACLLLAKASCFIHLEAVIHLELDEILLEFLFHSSLVLVNGDQSICSNLYDCITKLDPIWPKLVDRPPKMWDLQHNQTFRQAKSFAFLEAKKIILA